MVDIRKTSVNVLAQLVCLAVLVCPVSADLVSLEYFDSATNPAFGGPLWTGVIDTVTNKLRIDTWTELPLHSSPEFWVPADLPQIWNAVDASGAEFDVTAANLFDINGNLNFGSDNPANAANDFAFISPNSMQALNWHPFDSSAGEPDTNTIVNFTDDIIFFPGWGGYAFVHPLNGLTFLVNQPSATSADDFDYRSVPALPTSADGVGSSTAATVTITEIIDTDVATIGVVPEASAFLGIALVAGLSAANAMRRKNLRNS